MTKKDFSEYKYGLGICPVCLSNVALNKHKKIANHIDKEYGLYCRGVNKSAKRFS